MLTYFVKNIHIFSIIFLKHISPINLIIQTIVVREIFNRKQGNPTHTTHIHTHTYTYIHTYIHTDTHMQIHT